MLAKDIVGDKPFFFHLGDLYVPSSINYKNMIKAYEQFKVPAVIGLKKIDNVKQYGIAYGNKISKNIYKLHKVSEKPKTSTSKLGLTGINIFEKEIFDAAKKTKKSKKGEIELTDCVQTLIKNKQNVIGYELSSRDFWIDMGTPANYFKALKHSYNVR